MRIGYHLKHIFCLFGAISASELRDSPLKVLDRKGETEDIMTRDIAIIGGGASGTYAAFQLRDLNQSVVVIERKNRMGGHTETYTDPATGINIEIGVEEYHNIDLVKNFFARFNISLTSESATGPSGIIQDIVDFRTGKIVTNYTPLTRLLL